MWEGASTCTAIHSALSPAAILRAARIRRMDRGFGPMQTRIRSAAGQMS